MRRRDANTHDSVRSGVSGSSKDVVFDSVLEYDNFGNHLDQRQLTIPPHPILMKSEVVSV